jgi:hypothetical protein
MPCSQKFANILEKHTASIFRVKEKARAVNQHEAGGKQKSHEDGGNVFLLFATSFLLITLLGLLVDPENVVPSSETSVNF